MSVDVPRLITLCFDMLSSSSDGGQLGLDLVVGGRLSAGLRQLLSPDAWDYLASEAANAPPSTFSRDDWSNFITLVLEGEQAGQSDAGHRQLLRRLIASGLAASGPSVQRDAALALAAMDK